jgi:hypothetical protein
LNVDFADAHFLGATAPITLGDLALCGVAVADGTSVRGLLAIANNLLGGLPGSYSIADVESILNSVNGAFFAGTPSQFAQDHLVNGACP